MTADETRKLTTILAIDVVGYSAAAERDQVGATRRVAALRECIEQRAAEHRGRVFNTAGDGFMLEFALASDAVRAAIALLEEAHAPGSALPAIRAGAHLGEVMVEGDNLMGHGVNVAARLVTLAEPNSLVISDAVKAQLHGEVDAPFTRLGQVQLAKMRGAMLAHAYTPGGAVGGWRRQLHFVARRRWRTLAVAASLIIVGVVAAGVLLSRSTRYELETIQLVAHSENPEMFPTISPDGRVVVYMVEHGSTTFTDTELYMRSVVGGEETQLTNTSDFNEGIPAFSPSGDRLAYARWSRDGEDECQIMLRVFPNGLDREVAACTSYGPNRLSWTPDGRSLVFAGHRDERALTSVIMMLDSETGDVREVLAPPDRGLGDTAPVVSPDGRRLAFVRYDSAENARVYVFNMQTARLVPITEVLTWAQVAWADASNLFVFTSSSPTSTEIWLRRADGNGNGERLAPAFTRLARPSVVPGLLAVQVETRTMNLFRATGGAATPLTNGNQMDFSPDFSRDGTLAFISARSEDWIYVQQRGEAPRRLADVSGREPQSLRWSPDGRQIAFSGLQDGRSAIFIVDAASGLVQEAPLQTEENAANPSWSPDGRSLIFTISGADGPYIARQRLDGDGAIESLSAPGWHEAIETPDGLFAIGRSAPGIWRLAHGRAPEVIVREFQPELDNSLVLSFREWAISGDRIYFVDHSGEDETRILSQSIAGGAASVIGVIHVGADNLAVDPVSGDLIYGAVVDQGYDIAVIPFRRR